MDIAKLRTEHPDHWLRAAALRMLAIDAVEKANSGHPGMPMGMADVATVLFSKHLKFDAAAPGWADRDRFILSAGHGSMLLYGLLYLTGYADMTIEQIKAFRQWGSQNRRPSGIWPCRGDRDHHRPAGPGAGEFGRLRHRGRSDAGKVRRQDRRSPHLGDRWRRLPDGGHQPRGDRAGGDAEAVEAGGALGQQRHLDRRQGGAVRYHRPAQALRGRGLDGAGLRRPRPRRHRPGADRGDGPRTGR